MIFNQQPPEGITLILTHAFYTNKENVHIKVYKLNVIVSLIQK